MTAIIILADRVKAKIIKKLTSCGLFKRSETVSSLKDKPAVSFIDQILFTATNSNLIIKDLLINKLKLAFKDQNQSRQKVEMDQRKLAAVESV